MSAVIDHYTTAKLRDIPYTNYHTATATIPSGEIPLYQLLNRNPHATGEEWGPREPMLLSPDTGDVPETDRAACIAGGERRSAA